MRTKQTLLSLLIVFFAFIFCANAQLPKPASVPPSEILKYSQEGNDLVRYEKNIERHVISSGIYSDIPDSIRSLFSPEEAYQLRLGDPAALLVREKIIVDSAVYNNFFDIDVSYKKAKEFVFFDSEIGKLQYYRDVSSTIFFPLSKSSAMFFLLPFIAIMIVTIGCNLKKINKKLFLLFAYYFFQIGIWLFVDFIFAMNIGTYDINAFVFPVMIYSVFIGIFAYHAMDYYLTEKMIFAFIVGFLNFIFAGGILIFGLHLGIINIKLDWYLEWLVLFAGGFCAFVSFSQIFLKPILEKLKSFCRSVGCMEDN